MAEMQLQLAVEMAFWAIVLFAAGWWCIAFFRRYHRARALEIRYGASEREYG